MSLKKNIFIFFLIGFLQFPLTAQIGLTENTFLSQSFIISLESGITYGFSDYKNSSLGPAIYGSIEYYPLIIKNGRLGLKVFGGGQQVHFSDPRTSMSSNDGPRNVISKVYTDIIQLGMGLSFGYALSENVIPSITLGTAYLNFSPKSSAGKVLKFNHAEKYKKEIFVFALEGDLKVKISDRFSFNSVIGYYPTSTDYFEDISASSNNDTYLTALVGFSFALSGDFDSDGDGISNSNDLCPGTPENVKVDEFGCPIDIDKDGVPDYLDKCPNTPIGVIVDQDGCPIDSDKDGVPDYKDKCPDTPTNLVVDIYGCPKDSDNDGVPDYLDKCENTPLNVLVDENGCPMDTDKDGVPDYLDKCPGTSLNIVVDPDGCPDKSVDQEIIYQFNLRGEDTFINSSANLNESIKSVLNEIALYIKNQIGSKWRVEGHMDSQGAVYSIKKLSYDRAKTVYDYLVSLGVSQNQLEVYGLGDSFPIGNNNTFEGRKANRRIMIIRED
jgi:OmpA-OmpF porin, OOP family